jgi:hypothetical protein
MAHIAEYIDADRTSMPPAHEPFPFLGQTNMVGVFPLEETSCSVDVIIFNEPFETQ